MGNKTVELLIKEFMGNPAQGPWLLGAGFESSVVLQGRGVSERHLMLIPEPPFLVAFPLGMGRTMLNGETLIGPAELRPGDRIELGTQEISWDA